MSYKQIYVKPYIAWKLWALISPSSEILIILWLKLTIKYTLKGNVLWAIRLLTIFFPLNVRQPLSAILLINFHFQLNSSLKRPGGGSRYSHGRCDGYPPQLTAEEKSAILGMDHIIKEVSSRISGKFNIRSFTNLYYWKYTTELRFDWTDFLVVIQSIQKLCWHTYIFISECKIMLIKKHWNYISC